MATTTETTTKQKRRRIAKGVLVTSTNSKTYKTIRFLESIDVKVIRHFKTISYTGIAYSLINI